MYTRSIILGLSTAIAMTAFANAETSTIAAEAVRKISDANGSFA